MEFGTYSSIHLDLTLGENEEKLSHLALLCILEDGILFEHLIAECVCSLMGGSDGFLQLDGQLGPYIVSLSQMCAPL